MGIRFRLAAVILAVLPLAACGEAQSDAPDDASLKDSFAQQLATNKFVRDYERNGDDLTFTAPDGKGGDAKWRIHIDLAAVMEYPSEKQPYKGTINSSWFANDQPMRASGTESNLPIELLDNGVSQDCWAFWDPVGKKWDW